MLNDRTLNLHQDQGTSHSEGVPPRNTSSPCSSQQNQEGEEDLTHAESISTQQVASGSIGIDELIELQASQSGTTGAPNVAFADATTSVPLATVDLKLAEILSFLWQYHEFCPDLQMACPIWGSPLPSIDIQFNSNPELSMKITLSLRLCEWLMKHVEERRATVMRQLWCIRRV
jgi:hypothetical protein